MGQLAGLGSRASVTEVDMNNLLSTTSDIFTQNDDSNSTTEDLIENNVSYTVSNKTPRNIYLQWIHMSISFSLTVSTIISTVGLSVGVFGSVIGGYGTAALYAGIYL